MIIYFFGGGVLLLFEEHLLIIFARIKNLETLSIEFTHSMNKTKEE